MTIRDDELHERHRALCALMLKTGVERVTARYVGQGVSAKVVEITTDSEPGIIPEGMITLVEEATAGILLPRLSGWGLAKTAKGTVRYRDTGNIRIDHEAVPVKAISHRYTVRTAPREETNR